MQLRSLITKVVLLAVKRIVERIDMAEVTERAADRVSHTVDMEALQDKARDRIVEDFDMEDLQDKARDKILGDLSTDDVVEKVKDLILDTMDVSQLVSYPALVRELDYQDMARYLNVTEVADEVDTDVVATKVVDLITLDYFVLGKRIDYEELGKHLNPMEALAGAQAGTPPDSAEALTEPSGALVDRLLEKAVCALLLAANRAVELEEIEEATK